MKTTIKNIIDHYNSKYKRHIIELNYLPLGNNFKQDHLIKSILEHEQFNDLLEYLENIPHYNDEVEIISKGKYCNVSSGPYVVFELCDLLTYHYNKILT